MEAVLTLQDIGAYRDRLCEVEEPLLFALPVADPTAQRARDRACELSAELIGELARLERCLGAETDRRVTEEPPEQLKTWLRAQTAPSGRDHTPRAETSTVRLSGVRLPAAAQRVVVGHLKAWPALRAELRELECDQLQGGYETSFEPRSGGGRPANPTQARALRLADDKHASELKRVVGAIARALEATDERVAKAIKAHYLASMAWGTIAERMEVERQTIWRWQLAFNVAVWEQLRAR